MAEQYTKLLQLETSQQAGCGHSQDVFNHRSRVLETFLTLQVTAARMEMFLLKPLLCSGVITWLQKIKRIKALESQRAAHQSWEIWPWRQWRKELQAG